MWVLEQVYALFLIAFRVWGVVFTLLLASIHVPLPSVHLEGFWLRLTQNLIQSIRNLHIQGNKSKAPFSLLFGGSAYCNACWTLWCNECLLMSMGHWCLDSIPYLAFWDFARSWKTDYVQKLSVYGLKGLFTRSLYQQRLCYPSLFCTSLFTLQTFWLL